MRRTAGRWRRSTGKPTLILLRTIIAWPAPTKQDTGKSHGSALGDAEIAGLKESLGFDPAKTFEVSRELLAHTRQVKSRGKAAHKAWEAGFRAWRGLDKDVPVFPEDPKGVATRAASGKVLSALSGVLPELWGGSADLAESNNTTMAGAPSFIPKSKQTREWSGGPYGRTLHFGIREFGMGLILNGIALEGLTRPYGGTFLVFSDYMRPAVRLAAIQHLPFVWTHDSIGLGEDGPTHQPIEHLAALRAIPDFDVVRPGDANETAAAWIQILRNDRAAGLCLSRQPLPTQDPKVAGKVANVAKGAYILREASSGTPQVILIATGSEVGLAMAAAEQLEKAKIATRVVSMPCREWFEQQSRAYHEKVLPSAVRARVSIEAGVPMGWRDLVGDAGEIVAIDHFGASADAATLFREFGFTPEKVVAAAKRSIKNADARSN